jgi:NADPH-dependent ferric siderophore reductase
MNTSGSPATRLRREPPTFRRVEVRQVSPVSARLLRVTFTGADLDGLLVEQPAASVRLLLPGIGAAELAMPAWNGNEFLLPDGRRPAIRTFTPRRLGPQSPELELDVVVHDGGVASAWVQAAAPGHQAAISGPGRGYPVDPEAQTFLLAGDESAIPAISQLLEILPSDKTVQVHLEVAHPDARHDLPKHAGATVEWHDLPAGAPPGDAVVAAVMGAASDLTAGARVWAAGEAAAVQRIRRHLFQERNLPRSSAWIRGYWKHGRMGDADDDD